MPARMTPTDCTTLAAAARWPDDPLPLGPPTARVVLAVVAQLMHFSEEHRERIRQAHLGRTRSEEHRRAIAEGARRAWARRHAEQAKDALDRWHEIEGKEATPGIPAPGSEEDAPTEVGMSTTPG